MKFHTFPFLILTWLLSANLHAATPSAADEAASALVARVLPEHAKFFVVDTSLHAQDGKDVFAISDTKDGKIANLHKCRVYFKASFVGEKWCVRSQERNSRTSFPQLEKTPVNHIKQSS